MNINFDNLAINRVVMHTIIAKRKDEDTASCKFDNSLVEVTDEVIRLIKKRLVDAAGKNSRAFELEINDTHEDSFFFLCNEITGADNSKFLELSRKITKRLALSQTRTIESGGYLILIDSQLQNSQRDVYIVIKAELHEALRQKQVDGKSTLQMLNDIFLSPSQKLYKIGAIFERLEEKELPYPNNEYSGFLFDDQFRYDNTPAEYFYKDFLGFHTKSNSKLLTRSFFKETKDFILKNFDDYETKNGLLASLKVEMDVSKEKSFTPSEFRDKYLDDDSSKLKFSQQVVDHFPSTFVKDTSLLDHDLKNKKITFPNNIKIMGPEKKVNTNVKIFENNREFQKFDNTNNHTVVLIKGKPFKNG